MAAVARGSSRSLMYSAFRAPDAGIDITKVGSSKPVGTGASDSKVSVELNARDKNKSLPSIMQVGASNSVH
jgi:hypothetical protein